MIDGKSMKKHIIRIPVLPTNQIVPFANSTSGQYKAQRPIGVAVNEKYVFIAEWESSQVTVLDRLTREVITHIGSRGRGDGELLNPTGLAYNNGLLFVCDGLNHRICVFDCHNGGFNFLYHIGVGKLRFPAGVHAMDGKVYCVCQGDSCVYIFDLNGKLIKKFKAKGVGAGQICVSAIEEIYVSEQDKGRVRVFDTTGKELRIIGSGELKEPVGITIRDQTIYVADQLNDRVIAYDCIMGDQLECWECTHGALPTGVCAYKTFVYCANYSENCESVSILSL
jgi:DNA-binding beta-propeller fold protein YncE